MALPVPASAGWMTVPGRAFFARNASGVPLTCRIRLDRQDWSAFFVVQSGGEISMRTTTPDSTLSGECRSPMTAGIFVMQPGQRYAFLKARNGRVDIRLVDTPK